MQQVFGTLNTFLQQDESTRQRHLRIRTYKVVPLSRRSGLLEWLFFFFLFQFILSHLIYCFLFRCVNTMPIGNYLLGELIIG
jgi:phosphatidylinositol kinase/protein kinase (PI-3  family)